MTYKLLLIMEVLLTTTVRSRHSNHMDTAIGHEVEGDLQAHGYPILWLQYLQGDGASADALG